MDKNQKGFGHLGIFIAVVVLALVGLTGWYVMTRSKDNSNKSKNSSNSAKTNDSSDTSPEDPETFQIPEGYVAYENKELGFKFAYPSAWGKAKDDSSVPGNGDKKYFAIAIVKDGKNIALIRSFPKDSCPQGDGIATSSSQGWYEKNGSYYDVWCKYSSEANGTDYPVGNQSDVVKKISDSLLVKYTGNVADDPQDSFYEAAGLFNLTNNDSYTGLSIDRNAHQPFSTVDKQEFEKVLATLTEL